MPISTSKNMQYLLNEGKTRMSKFPHPSPPPFFSVQIRARKREWIHGHRLERERERGMEQYEKKIRIFHGHWTLLFLFSPPMTNRAEMFFYFRSPQGDGSISLNFSYIMSKKSCPVSYSDSLHRNGQALLDILYIKYSGLKGCVSFLRKHVFFINLQICYFSRL